MKRPLPMKNNVHDLMTSKINDDLETWHDSMIARGLMALHQRSYIYLSDDLLHVSVVIIGLRGS